MDDKLRSIEKRIDRVMVGRYSEMEMFKKQFDHVLEGGMGLTIVSGQPGIGKTFFVDRAVSLAIGGNATYLRGKFRQYDSKPLIAIAEVIEQAVRYILTLPTEALKHIKSELLQKQGADPAVILAICPYAEKLLGSRKAINIDNLEQLKYRVKKAVCYFLETISTALFPLIIFFDDLQWADNLSMNIIEALREGHEYLNLHLVLAYREGDTGQASLNQGILSQGGDIFELGGLNYEDIHQYIRLIFKQNIEDKDYLTKILYGLTLGNPFNMSRILRLLLQEGALIYSPAGPKWLVRHDKLEKLNLPADIEQLLTRQIEGLQEEDKALLRLISCCGEEVPLRLLKRLTDPEEALTEQLDRLCQKSLLVKILLKSEPDKESNGYSFAHDIVLKQVYNSIVPCW